MFLSPTLATLCLTPTPGKTLDSEYVTVVWTYDNKFLASLSKLLYLTERN